MRSERRSSALSRLQIQLKKGVKNTNEGLIDLTDKDKKRIEKEIVALKTRVTIS